MNDIPREWIKQCVTLEEAIAIEKRYVDEKLWNSVMDDGKTFGDKMEAVLTEFFRGERFAFRFESPFLPLAERKGFLIMKDGRVERFKYTWVS